MRLERIELVDTGRDVAELIGECVDAVERVEDRPQRRADRNVETVWLPIEVVAQRPEEVVEVGDLVAQVLGRGDGVLERLGLLVGDGAGLLLQRILLLQNVDRVVDLVDLFEQVGTAGLLVGQVLDLRRAAALI